MQIELECTYCGYKWETVAYSQQSVEKETCPKCRDSHLKVKDLKQAKIDTYKGCPPFPEKNKKDWTWNMCGVPPGSIL